MRLGATWATVGMLFNEDWEQWERNTPNIIPDYSKSQLSAYDFGKSIKSTKTKEFCFAPDLIRKIINTKNQELATHTYSHYYCREEGQNLESFTADLEMSKAMAKDIGFELRSLVFPRNQMNEKYFRACRDIGITSVRSNPDFWYWEDTQKDTLSQKIFRTGDAYFGKKNKSYKGSEVDRINDISIQPASRLLRPFSENNILNHLKLRRVTREMEKAAINNEIYHLWWHPHNFGNSPEKNLQDLIIILEVYKELNSKYNFLSLTMDELKNKLQN